MVGKNSILADFAQEKDFGGLISVYIKLPDNLLSKTLAFYRYNPITDGYALEQMDYLVDANGYVHFKTNNAENLIISAI